MAKIESNQIVLVPIEKITPNPKNANMHPIEQIQRLEKLIEYQCFRNPLVISNRTGFLIVGHGRLEAATNIGMTKLPVIYQDFISEAQEYAYLVSDNEIARWAELDEAAVVEELKVLELDDLELLGIDDFKINMDDDNSPAIVEEPKSFSFKIKCDDLTEIAILQKKFNIAGDTVAFSKFSKLFPDCLK